MGSKRDKASILVDVEMLLDVYEPAFLQMPKMQRLHGPAIRFEQAAYDLLNNFYIAYNLGPDEAYEKKQHINMMIGCFGIMQSSFKRLMKMKLGSPQRNNEGSNPQMSLMSNRVKLGIAECMERIEESIVKWKKSINNARHNDKVVS